MKRISSRMRVGRLLLSRLGKIVTSAEIQEAVGPNVTEWARRLRELRNEEGWKISSHNDRADLKPGEYVLEEPPPETGAYRFSKPVSSRIRAQVLERNGYTCQMCGVGAGESLDNDRTARLHIGHIVDRSHGGKDRLDNLRALCSDCNQGARNIAQEPPSYTWTLSQVRRAPENDQKKIYAWLKNKFRK